jgi:N-acetyl-gamma-glutamyl-phosphate reductase
VESATIDSSDIVVVAASGTSGAGRSASESLLATEIMGSMTSYKTGGVHQHTPEIEQTLSNLGGNPVKISFTPLLAPMSRGIHATVTAKLVQPLTAEAAYQLYEAKYRNSPFVHVLPVGEQPRTANVLGTNHVQLQVLVDEHTQRLVVTVVIDNLVKGAAGQAIQNANLMFGLNQSTGLDQMGVAP